ncbi:hypothetical protein PT974_02067 [Cladobotryum mycophilum]|uniref:Alcohol acetyltransferase n=1 Tax=Cladobotryum mycophilum TaxID=491253 RepID=A0ABR0SX99_9HYPO
MLRVGIAGQDTFAAHFTHLAEVDLRHQIDLVAIPCDTVEEYEGKVAEEHGLRNDTVFVQDVETRPPWRVTILRPAGGVLQHLEQKQQEDVIFTFHHSLMDGTSGRRFHEMLLSAIIQLSKQPSTEPVHVIPFPEPPTLPEQQEDVVPFKFSLAFTGRVLWNEFGPSIFKSQKPPSGTAKTSTSPCLIGQTLPSQLHDPHGPNPGHGPRIAGNPSPPSRAGQGIHCHHPHQPPPLYVPHRHRPIDKGLPPRSNHHFRAPLYPCHRLPFQAPDADITALIWQTAKLVKDELNDRTATLPRDDMTGMLKHITDWTSFWNKKDGQPRTHSWEVSNIGVLKNAEEEKEEEGEEAHHPRITRVLFTNPAMVTGAAVGLGVGSAAGGRLTLGISWQDTIVSDELVENLVKDLYSYTTTFQETGRFT